MNFREGVHAVRAGPQIILLDERANRYLALSERQAEALEAAKPGAQWPTEVKTLMERGLLANTRQDGPVCLDPAKPPPTGSFLESEFEPGLGLADLPKTLLSFERAHRAIARHGLSKLLAWQRRPHKVAPAGVIHRAAGQFLAARPWVPLKPVCLVDSVALLAFLRERGLHAELVIGVRPTPFEAHCWVEHAGLVLNDTVLRARTFTPILAA